MRLAASRRPLSPCQAVSINARRRAAGVRTLLFLLFGLSPNPPPCSFVSFLPWKLPLGGAAQFLKPLRFTCTDSQKCGHIHQASNLQYLYFITQFFNVQPELPSLKLELCKNRRQGKSWNVGCFCRNLLTQLD